MKLRNLFHEKLKNKLEKQRMLQESLEGFVKKYTPVFKRLVNEYPNLYFRKAYTDSDDMIMIDDETITKIIKYIHSLDPTSKEQFAKSIMNIFLNTLTYDLAEIKKINNDKVKIIDYTQEIRDTIKRYFNTIEYLKNNFKYNQNIKTLNQFERLKELKDYVRKLTDIAQELKLRKDSKGFDKMELVAETSEWEARVCWDEDQMVNTFGGWSDWCISKRNGRWEQYTGQEYLTQRNARPGIPIVFKNKTSNRNVNNQSIKFVCVILAYEDESFWEYRNRKDVDIYNDNNGNREELNASEQINEMEREVVDNLKKEYNVSSIWAIGEEKFGDIEGGYKDEENNYITTYNTNEYPNEDVEEVFGEIPIELEDGSWGVDEINVDDGMKDVLFYDFLSEINGLSYDKIINVYGNVFITYDRPDARYNLKLKIQRPSSVVSIGNLVEGLEIIETKSLEELCSTEGYKEIELNNAKTELIDVNSSDGEQFFIDNFSTNVFKIWGNKDIVIENGKIKTMEVDGFGGGITLNGSSTIELINCNYGNTFQILDCSRYNVTSNEKEITFNLDDSNDIKKNKVQYINIKSNCESIIFEIDEDQSEIVFDIDDVNKSLKKITLPSVDGVTFRVAKETFDNLETIDGDEDEIEIID